MEGGFASAAVLVSYGVMIGKLNFLQVTVMVLIEVPVYVLNAHLGFEILKCVDAGESSFFCAIKVLELTRFNSI